LDDLTLRKQQILRAVVIEYVETAEPVGSSLLVERYRLGVGSATVRHELAEMSERGFLEQPHTSSGRIPSDSGYRYYVDRLSQPQISSEQERRVRDVSKGEAALDDVLAETCKVLSRLSRHVALASTVGERNLTVRGVSVTGVMKGRVLLTVVFSSGMVENRIVQIPNEIALADLHQVSIALSEAAVGSKVRPLLRAAAPVVEGMKPAAAELLSACWKSLRSVCKAQTGGKVITEGTQYLFEQPEFQQDVRALGSIVSALESGSPVQDALEPHEGTTTVVSIGKENATQALSRLAIIASRFYVDKEEAGSIAIVGPTRMNYSTTLPLVETAAKALSDALSRFMA
jgi:heat-inducible transcriptional repressor